MKKERDKIKQRMIDINKLIEIKSDQMDTTGGETGMRHNKIKWNEINKLKKELMVCNRKLLN